MIDYLKIIFIGIIAGVVAGLLGTATAPTIMLGLLLRTKMEKRWTSPLGLLMIMKFSLVVNLPPNSLRSTDWRPAPQSSILLTHRASGTAEALRRTRKTSIKS